MSSSSTSSKVHQIIRDRILNILEVSKEGFAGQQAAMLELGEIKLDGVDLVGEDDTAPKRGAKAEVTVYMKVDYSCCNLAGNAHGGFLAWLVDLASSLPLMALAGHDRWTTSGVSSNINMYYIAGIEAGTEIQVVSTVLQQGKTAATLQARVQERGTGKLFALGMHTKQDTSGRKSKL